ncbi:uncharacterized protein LOC132704792 [Cylas formicarius]|uniref:uncharacterized protein LOC132704792 n=1 Tax=Cylas formicarius TaxID=197179 RepID=UPI002958C249|nr:uncharacterized protein LOC132704792 [Cylas formicarius]
MPQESRGIRKRKKVDKETLQKTEEIEVTPRILRKKIVKQMKERNIKLLVSQQKRKLDIDTEENNYYSEDDVPLSMRLQYQERKKRCLLPRMSPSSLEKLKSTLDFKESNPNILKLKECVSHMHGNNYRESHLLSLYFLRKAIVNSLFERRWDNLKQLLIMLIENYPKPVFNPFIRQMCQIIKTLDPTVAGSDFEEQLNIVEELYNKKTSNIVT